MAKYKKEFTRRQNFKEWCEYWFTSGKYIRKLDWNSNLQSICELRDVDYDDLKASHGNAYKFMYADVKFTGVCPNNELVHITERNILTGKWVMDNPLDSIWKSE